MSRALGAAFLNHQVEQLEKSVTRSSPRSIGNKNRISAHHRPTDLPRSLANPSKPASTTPHGIKVLKKNGPGSDLPYSVAEPPHKRGTRIEKDADTIVVDASVLVHGLMHLKKWCQDGRDDVVVVPLEALNALDLLKKGTTPLAQRARTASRLLEAQVGTNSRIRVQRDEAFVAWDDIKFAESVSGVNVTPEWVRRTICCAKWEAQTAEAGKPDAPKKPRVVLAVVKKPSEPSESSTTDPVSVSPIPLPAPIANRHEPRSSGTLVAQWAANAGVEILELSSVAPNSSPANAKDTQSINGGRRSGDQGRRSNELGRRSPEEDRSRRATPSVRGRRNSHMRNAERGPSPTAGLVERPPAVMAMMEMVSQPSRVVRVLARGEKLEPDP